MKLQYVFWHVKNRKYVAMDDASGGYPYLTEDPFQAKIWTDIPEAFSYKKIIGDDARDWDLWQVAILRVVRIP